MQNQTVCSEDSTVDITGCQPLEVHAGRSRRIINRSGGTWSRPCPRPMHVRFLLTTSTFTPVTTSITFRHIPTSISSPTLDLALPRGTIILLSGAPDRGKALTAESVAAESQVSPLATAAEYLDLRPMEMRANCRAERTYTQAKTPSSSSLTQPISYSKHATTMKSREMSSYPSSFVLFERCGIPRKHHFSLLRTTSTPSIEPSKAASTPPCNNAKSSMPNPFRTIPPDLPRQTQRFLSLRPPPAYATLRRRCQVLR